MVLARDLTPENSEDNLGNDRASVELTRIMSTRVSGSLHKDRYSYRRLVFDNVPIDELTLAVYADFYYLGDVSYNNEDFDIYEDSAYGTLCLYTFADKSEEIKLTKKDIEAIVSFK